MPIDEVNMRRLRQRVPDEKPLLQQNPEARALLQRLGGENKVMLQRAGEYKTPSPNARANFHALLNQRGKSSNNRGRGRNR